MNGQWASQRLYLQQILISLAQALTYIGLAEADENLAMMETDIEHMIVTTKQLLDDLDLLERTR